MRIHDMTNLWIAENKEKDFRVFVCALDREEALEIIEDYQSDAYIEGNFEILEYDSSISVDCDYIIT